MNFDFSLLKTEAKKDLQTHRYHTKHHMEVFKNAINSIENLPLTVFSVFIATR